MKFKIEKGVPIPKPERNYGLAAAIRKLKKGDSVELPVIPHNAARNARRMFGKGKFIARRTESGCRIWRIK